ncbi:DUF397 domain-containing protein [Amycolatopsis sp., V23-08]|uniref:DUF397 domain-containing protein n=1 Tax=Amycolatopsis heterodermiae TaxID=3110235 RepID=A0ABU5RDX8_9PSEU|nr:DUF397 domain-containing protein [Amycolatopsis sp., V23-08]MEA5364481.1 DUF397 domain-containing protein [Amycolatopsis sp., V23-08]
MGGTNGTWTPPDALNGLVWRKATASGPNGNCVEVATVGADFLVRDSKNPSDGQISVSSAGWAALMVAIKANAAS